MRTSLKNVLGAASIASLLAVAGCATDTGETDAGTGTLSEFDLSGVSVAVGSKDFDEQLILGEMMVAAFEEAGATVNNKVDLGGTNIARSALESGEIDIYMEYNGTGWVVHLGQENPSFDPDELTALVSDRDLAENSIAWIGRSPFNNTYGFASSPELTEANGGAFSLQTMMEYVQENPDAVVCMESEFPSRPDGLILTETATGITLPLAQQRILDTGIIYTETAANNCDFGEVFTTDGRIPALSLTLVDDPGVNILYNVSGTIREDKYLEAPEAFDGIINAILAPLDETRMAGLNALVSAEGLEPRQVARDFLIQEGLISG
jgi:osmoprotectant transport system substrate-binding protein